MAEEKTLPIYARSDEKSLMLSGKLIRSPGVYGFSNLYQSLEIGRQIRDELIHKFPLLPLAVDIFQSISATREWKVSGPPRSVPLAVDSLNNAECVTFEGYSEFGFEQFQRRRSLDHVTVGRTAYFWQDGESPRYLDPCVIEYDFSRSGWHDIETAEFFPVDDVIINHPKPIGRSGIFLSPLYSILPDATLAWLLREHDTASLDGRKIKDIIIAASKDLAEQMAVAIEDTIQLYSGKADVSKLGMPIVYCEDEINDVTKMISRVGISEVPPGFDRPGFEFSYANSVADATGLPLRRIWNSEKATNRALEQVQEQRQEQTGPSAYIRSEQRLLNGRNGLGRHFGKKTRFGFVEEVDQETRLVNAQVLELYSKGLETFANVFGGQVNGDALLAWLQSEDILPEDLKLITEIGLMQSSDSIPTPTDGNVQDTQGKNISSIIPTQDTTGTMKSFDAQEFLDYGEITMNSHGRIIERRSRVFSFQQVVEKALMNDAEFIEQIKIEKKPIDLKDALKEARALTLKRFTEIVHEEKSLDTVLIELKEDIMPNIDNPSTVDYRRMMAFIKTYDNNEKEFEIG